MEREKALERLQKLQLTLHAYNHALGVLYLDSATVAPRGAAASRSQTMGILSEKSHQLLTGTEMADTLAELRSMSGLTPSQTRQVEVLTEEQDKLTRIPVEEFVAFRRLVNEAETVWYDAKEQSDYPRFRPFLEKIIQYSRAFAAYKDASRPAYDALLDDYEKGMDQASLDSFFSALRERIVPLIMAVKDRPIRDDFLTGHFPGAGQEALAAELMRIMGLDGEHCALHTTEHPFTMAFHREDVRITTHYHEDMMASSLYSVIHEGGHALYELGIGDEYQYTCLADGASMGLHESQSRFYENIIGRSEAFLSFLFPTLTRLFPDALGSVTPRDFYRAVNRAKPSLIRVEADELTYSLHVMIRYELEKQLIAGTLNTRDLPEAWNRLYRDYLGVDVPDDARGVLQDTHWSGGAFGYFPSYALGSAYAAQFAHALRKDVAMDDLLREGNLAPVTEWLRENIHRHGMLLRPRDLLERVCGEPFDAGYYVAYLEGKMKDVYGG